MQEHRNLVSFDQFRHRETNALPSFDRLRRPMFLAVLLGANVAPPDLPLLAPSVELLKTAWAALIRVSQFRFARGETFTIGDVIRMWGRIVLHDAPNSVEPRDRAPASVAVLPLL